MRLRLACQLLATGALASALAACAHPAPEPAAPAPPPNPFGYLKPASVCVAPSPVLPAVGRGSASMSLSADGGFCAFHFSQGGQPFAAGLVIHVPMHGQPLIYNYNGATVVSYTPTAGYTGPDRMTVELVPGAGKPRVLLDLAIMVGATAAPAGSPPRA